MLRRSHFLAWPLAVLCVATIAAGCAKKSGESAGSASDSTVSATPAPPPSAAPAESAKAPTGDPAKLGTLPVKPRTPPEHVEVQHVLIGFQGTIPGKTITRTKDEAEKLAKDVLDRARKGESFDTLVQTYTDDQPPGIYDMANNGVPANTASQEFERSKMVAGFGDVAFRISPGNIDMAPYQPEKDKPGYSPFGWHIVKRLK